MLQKFSSQPHNGSDGTYWVAVRCVTEAFSTTCAILTYRRLWVSVVVRLSWHSGRELAAQPRSGVLGWTPGDCWPFLFWPHNIRFYYLWWYAHLSHMAVNNQCSDVITIYIWRYIKVLGEGLWLSNAGFGCCPDKRLSTCVISTVVNSTFLTVVPVLNDRISSSAHVFGLPNTHANTVPHVLATVSFSVHIS